MIIIYYNMNVNESKIGEYFNRENFWYRIYRLPFVIRPLNSFG